MKKLLVLCLLAACELQPAPKQAPTPAATATPPAPPRPPADAAIAVDAAVPVRRPPPQPAVQPTADCEKAAVRYTALFIAAAPPAQRGIYEQDRANTVRRTEIACTEQGWTPSALACIAQSKNDRDARACLVKFPPPGAPPAAVGSNGKPYHPTRD
jgi:hypothetical protein